MKDSENFYMVIEWGAPALLGWQHLHQDSCANPVKHAWGYRIFKKHRIGTSPPVLMAGTMPALHKVSMVFAVEQATGLSILALSAHEYQFHNHSLQMRGLQALLLSRQYSLQPVLAGSAHCACLQASSPAWVVGSTCSDICCAHAGVAVGVGVWEHAAQETIPQAQVFIDIYIYIFSARLS